jgi:thiol-disulfide isomerase/thioredoxin
MTLTSLEGKTMPLPNREGKYVLLDFWATWCAPCVADQPHLRAVAQRFSGRKDFMMIGVSLDFEEKELRGFLNSRGLSWPQAFGDTARAAAERCGVTGIPVLLLIDPKGKIAAADVPASEIGDRIAEWLKKDAAGVKPESP